MIIWVESIETKTIQSGANQGNSYDAVVVKDDQGKDRKFSLFDPDLKKLFREAKEGSLALDIVVEKNEKGFLNPISGKLVSEELLPPAKPLEHQEIPQPAPQAVGMVTNNICQLVVADKLTAIFGKKIGVELVKWYRAQVLGITRIPFEGADLPEYKVD